MCCHEHPVEVDYPAAPLVSNETLRPLAYTRLGYLAVPDYRIIVLPCWPEKEA